MKELALMNISGNLEEVTFNNDKDVSVRIVLIFKCIFKQDFINVVSYFSMSAKLFNLFLHSVHVKPNNLRNYCVSKCFISILLHRLNK